MSKYLVYLAVVILFFLTRLNLDFPITLDEAREAYTSYSLIEIAKDTNAAPPGLLFRADNNYLPTIPVYLRTIPLYLLGLGSLGVRILGVIFGFLGLYAFYKLSRLLFPQKNSLIAALILAVSPFFVQLNIFNLGLTLSLIFFLTCLYFYFKKNTVLFLVFTVLSALSSFWVIPACLGVAIYYFFKEKTVRTRLYFLLGLVAAFAIVFATNPGLGKYFIRQSLIQDLKPASFTYEIDKRLSFGKIISSPLITPKFNFNRLAFNKVYFGTLEFFKSLAKPFDYEYLTSSFQAQTILTRERLDSVALPRIFFWEAPLILFGIILFLKSKKRPITIILVSTFTSLIFFKDKALYLLIPAIAWFNSLALVYLIDNRKKLFYKLTLFILFLLFLGSFSDFVYRLKDQKLEWMGPNATSQYKIWNFLGDQDFKNEKIVVSDRLGDPAFYFLYYNQTNPEYFQKNKTLSHIPVNGTERILKVGSVEFRAFKYSEEDRQKDEIWVGLPGEFVGENKDFRQIKEVPASRIITRIPLARQPEKFFGDEIWIVKTLN